MSIIVEDCMIEQDIQSERAYDGSTVYKIKMKIGGTYYISVQDYTLNSAIKFRDEWRKSAGHGQ